MATTPALAHLTGIAPQFLVDDLDRAIAFYRHNLGFVVDFIYEGFYASVSRDGLASPPEIPLIRLDCAKAASRSLSTPAPFAVHRQPVENSLSRGILKNSL